MSILNETAGGKRLAEVYGDVVNVVPSVRPAAIATAPYNFVPLPDAVLPSPLDTSLDQEKDTQKALQSYLENKKATLSGRIALEIEALTPVFVGASEEVRDFFAYGDKRVIPGSTLRGMVKNLYKMITCGVWRDGEDAEDRHLCYRCIMAPGESNPLKKLNTHYNKIMVSKSTDPERKKGISKTRPAFLVYRDGEWYLYPLTLTKAKSIPLWEYQEKYGIERPFLENSRIIWGQEGGHTGPTAYIQVGIKDNKWHAYDAVELETADEGIRRKWGKQYYRRFQIDDIDRSQPGGIPVPEHIITEYDEDRKRAGVDLLKELRVQAGEMKREDNYIIPPKTQEAPKQVEGLPAYDGIVPCSYTMNEAGEITSIGHGEAYRIPYEKTIFDALGGEVKSDTIDFTDAVFGRSATREDPREWASRLSFEDAPAEKGAKALPASKTRFLMEPNPTSFQLYLEQDDPKGLIHWDRSRTRLRGYKLYWHKRQENSWVITEKEQELEKGDGPAKSKEIAPLKEGTRFAGCIHFRDLTEEELGALCKVFELAENGEEIAYKIGMGKSIGLGSIRIRPTLYLEDGSRYKKLFDKSGWHVSTKEQSTVPYVEAFETYVRKARGGKVVQSYEATLEALRQMLDFRTTKNKHWNSATAGMAGPSSDEERSYIPEDQQDKRFANRNILPTAAEVRELVRSGDAK